ncbi:MAG: hypothetical protein WC755_09170 [Candidatus Woesearchaeota archaeon]|jgi:hypothetical protein
MKNSNTYSEDLLAIINGGMNSDSVTNCFAKNITIGITYNFSKFKRPVASQVSEEVITVEDMFPVELNISSLNGLYDFSNRNEIFNFLARHQEIIPSIMECSRQISNIFGNMIPKIEIVIDSELPDWKTLFIIIPCIDENIDLKLFDLLKWSFKQSKEFKKLVTITAQ